MRALFCSLATEGFLFPHIGIAEEFVRRGHSVAFVSDQTMSSHLAVAGLQRIERGPVDGASFQVSAWAHPEAMVIQVKHLSWAIKQFHPDLIISQQLCMGPLIIQELCRLPVITVGGVAYLWPSHISYNDDSVRRHRDWRYGDVSARLSQAFRMCGLQSDLTDISLDGDIFFLRSVPELQPVDGLPSSVQLAGACLWEPDNYEFKDALCRWLEEQDRRCRPILYVHQGKFFGYKHFWPEVRAAAEKDGFAVMASTASMDCDIGDIPETFFLRPYIPLTTTLAHSSALISSANTTAVVAACCAAVPSLLVPCGGEQPDVAAVCRQAGISHICSIEEATSERISSFFQKVCSGCELNSRAEEIAAAFSRVDSFSHIADISEKMMLRSQSAVF